MRLMGTPEEVTGPVNLGNPNEFTIKQLAVSVIELTNSSSRIDYRPLPTDDPKQRQPNIQKARDLLDWKPTVQLKEGLKQTISYFERLLGEERSAAAT
jgi:UDP-glucuronate decarboxylase